MARATPPNDATAPTDDGATTAAAAVSRRPFDDGRPPRRRLGRRRLSAVLWRCCVSFQTAVALGDEDEEVREAAITVVAGRVLSPDADDEEWRQASSAGCCVIWPDTTVLVSGQPVSQSQVAGAGATAPEDDGGSGGGGREEARRAWRRRAAEGLVAPLLGTLRDQPPLDDAAVEARRRRRAAFLVPPPRRLLSSFAACLRSGWRHRCSETTPVRARSISNQVLRLSCLLLLLSFSPSLEALFSRAVALGYEDEASVVTMRRNARDGDRLKAQREAYAACTETYRVIMTDTLGWDGVSAEEP